jgi:hypothetical protein
MGGSIEEGYSTLSILAGLNSLTDYPIGELHCLTGKLGRKLRVCCSLGSCVLYYEGVFDRLFFFLFETRVVEESATHYVKHDT